MFILILSLLFPAPHFHAKPQPGEVVEGRAPDKGKSSKGEPAKSGKKKKPKPKKVGFSSWSERDFFRCYFMMVEGVAADSEHPEGGDAFGVQIMTDAPVFSEDQPDAGSVVDDSGEQRNLYYAFSFEMPREFLASSPNAHHYVVAMEEEEGETEDLLFDVSFDGQQLVAERKIGQGTELMDRVEVTFNEELDPVELTLSLSRRAVVEAKIKQCVFDPPAGDTATPEENAESEAEDNDEIQARKEGEK
jgi:hypothetical protein